MIAPSLALLSYRRDLRDEIARRPAVRLIDRLLPEPAAVADRYPIFAGNRGQLRSFGFTNPASFAASGPRSRQLPRERERRERTGGVLLLDARQACRRPRVSARNWIAGLWPTSITDSHAVGDRAQAIDQIARPRRGTARPRPAPRRRRPARAQCRRASRARVARKSRAPVAARCLAGAGVPPAAPRPGGRAGRADGRDRPGPGRPSSTWRGAAGRGVSIRRRTIWSPPVTDPRELRRLAVRDLPPRPRRRAARPSVRVGRARAPRRRGARPGARGTSSGAAPAPATRCARTARRSAAGGSCRACCATCRNATCARPCSAREMPAPGDARAGGVQTILHPDGEIARARAAAALGLPVVASTAAARSMEEVAQAAGDAPRWFQLYRPKDDEITREPRRRARSGPATARSS